MTDARTLRFDLAVTPLARARGLFDPRFASGAKSLVLAPCHSIHTIGMRERLDVAFVSREGLVVRSERAVARGRVLRQRAAHLVIERCCAPDDPWPTAGSRLTFHIRWEE